MRVKWIFLLGACMCAFLTSGCYTDQAGRQKPGVPFMTDQIERRYERTASEIWTASKDVLNYNGSLYSEDLLTNTLEGSVNERRVWVRVQELDRHVTRVVVQARTKGGLRDMVLVGEIHTQIAVRLATGNLTPATSSFAPAPVTAPGPAPAIQ